MKPSDNVDELIRDLPALIVLVVFFALAGLGIACVASFIIQALSS